MTTELDAATLDSEVQGLALTGYSAPCMRTLLLTVANAVHARRFIATLIDEEQIAFGIKERIAKGLACKINVGFTYDGLRALGAPSHILEVFKDKSPAFAEGASVRAARFLGDAGESAVERWDRAFHPQRAHVWIAIYGPDAPGLKQAVEQLKGLRGATEGLSGWEPSGDLPDGKHLRDQSDPEGASRVHFGFRDSITKPSILEGPGLGKPGPDKEPFLPQPGELLLGHPNNDGADLWLAEENTRDDVAEFLRNGSFGVLRKVEQYVQRLDDYLETQAAEWKVTSTYLRAKMCGRWPNGAPVLPDDTDEPKSPKEDRLKLVDFQHDREGLGCPLGAHIRRANPRDDPLMPARNRTLFRRGIPYGNEGDEDVGLLGVFFCSRIEDQFEHLISEWLEKNPMGPRNRGRAKDPLVGNHDEPEAQFHIPRKGEGQITLAGFPAFVRTRGTLYAFFPSLQALKLIAGGAHWRDATRGPATRPARSRSMGSLPPAPAVEAPSADEPKEKPRLKPMDAPNDRFCDIVMEGGITSGVIYASAVTELARHYRFRNIGGSSIGAFAAALTAAAEYRRRHGSGEGFERLEKLPERLAQEENGKTRLERCFVPQRGTRRLFAIFLASLECSGMMSVVLFGLKAALRQYWKLAVGVNLLLLAVVLAGPLLAVQQCWTQAGAQCLLPLVSWSTALLLTLGVGTFSALVVGIGWDLARGVVPNGFGLCRGWDPDAKPDSEDLASFLHYSIQHVAGREADGKPLTFRDLWDAPGSADKALGFDPPENGTRSINLEVYSSNLTHGRPYRFPLDEAQDMGRLFFRMDELECYFPKGIVQYVAAFSKPYQNRGPADPDIGTNATSYLELPVEDLPIVVAARLAMSFPLLISAIPLYAVMHGERTRAMRKCWMSDGGLCSNFPIHLFDSFLPMWPTFGISLNSRDENNQDPVRLPPFHTSGRADSWDQGPETGPGRLIGFLLSLWKTTWRWNDSTMMRMPGVRDRVVRLYLAKGEGGVNIRMPAKRIRQLGETYGTPAAKAFIRKFQSAGSRGWQEHRWVRLNCLMISLRERIRNFSKAAAMDRHTTPLHDQLTAALESAPLGKPEWRSRSWPSEEKLVDKQVCELQSLVNALCKLEEAFLHTKENEPFRAVPRSSLRIRHPT